MNRSIFFVFFPAFWCINQSAETDPKMYKALFFSRLTERLVEVSQYDNRSQCSFCISACPFSSNSDTQKLLNDKVSVTKNSIFSRQAYEGTIFAKNVPVDICTEPPIPQLIYNTIVDSYEMGYEMYYEAGIRVGLQCRWYTYFKKVINGNTIQEENQPPNEDLIIIHENTDNTKFEIVTNQPKKQWLGTNKQWVFYWISILEIKVSPSMHQRLILYKKDTFTENFNKVETIYTCKHHYTGDGRQTTEDEDDSPTPPPNKKQKVDHGSSSTSETKVQKDDTENRLVKTQILPMLMLNSLAARVATCIHLNFAFVWETIATQRLKSVDMFLYALYRHFPFGIDIDFGVNSDSGKVNQTTHEHELFLKFPIPEQLYRVVQYKLNGIDYVAVIVIHNNPDANRETEKICPQDVLKSWSDTEVADETSGLSYACSLTSELAQKFQYHEFGTDPDVNDLELNLFPSDCEDYEDESTSTEEPCYDNVIDDIREELETIKKEYNSITNSSSS